MAKSKKMSYRPKSGKKGLYQDCTNGMDSKKFWNLINATKGKVPQNYQSAVLPMNNDKA